MHNRRSGGAVVEMALMMPWLVFLFVGILDFGFYSYAAICTQNAARAAAIQTSQISPGAETGAELNAAACTAALGEMVGLPNMAGVTTCATTTSCPNAGALGNAGSYVVACVVTLTCNTSPLCADCNSTVCAQPYPPPPQSMQAWVSYRTAQMVPIPGVLTGRLTLTRSAEVRSIQK